MIAPQLSRATVRVIKRTIAPRPARALSIVRRGDERVKAGEGVFRPRRTPALLSARNVIAAVLVLLSFVVAGTLAYRAKIKAAAAMQPAAGDLNLSLKSSTTMRAGN